MAGYVCVDGWSCLCWWMVILCWSMVMSVLMAGHVCVGWWTHAACHASENREQPSSSVLGTIRQCLFTELRLFGLGVFI